MSRAPPPEESMEGGAEMEAEAGAHQSGSRGSTFGLSLAAVGRLEELHTSVLPSPASSTDGQSWE